MTDVDRSHCYFCPKAALYSHVSLYNDIPPGVPGVSPSDRRPQLGLPLCKRCYDTLDASGSGGRLHRASGVRWWTCIYAPQLTRPDRLPWYRDKEQGADAGTAARATLDPLATEE